MLWNIIQIRQAGRLVGFRINVDLAIFLLSHISNWKQEITNLWKFKWRGRESNPVPLAAQAKSLTTRPPLLRQAGRKLWPGHGPFSFVCTMTLTLTLDIRPSFKVIAWLLVADNIYVKDYHIQLGNRLLWLGYWFLAMCALWPSPWRLYGHGPQWYEIKHFTQIQDGSQEL